MRIIPSPYSNKSELPLKLKISFEAVFDYLEKTAKDSLNCSALLNESFLEV